MEYQQYSNSRFQGPAQPRAGPTGRGFIEPVRAIKAPSAFWAQLLVASSADPTVQSTTVAFRVVPLAADVDDLKDAVVAKMRLGVAAPLLEVWAHDAASNQWVPVDEGSALVANEKATAYHVVVPTPSGGSPKP